MSLVPPIILELRAKAGEVHTELAKVGKETSKMVSETEGGSKKMQAAYHGAAGAGKAITFGIAGAALAVGGFAIESGSAAQVVEAKLNTALKNAGSSYEALKPKIEAADSANRKYGFTNDQTETALATLTTATGSSKKALADLSLAADLAKAKNIDLNSAALMVAKTSNGQARALMSLGIQLPIVGASGTALATANAKVASTQTTLTAAIAAGDNKLGATTKQHKVYEKALAASQAAQAKLTSLNDAGAQMMAALQKRVHGAAAAYGDTFAGKMASARAGVEAMGEKLGAVLIPIVEKVIAVGEQWSAYLVKNKPLLIAIAAVIGGVLLIAIGAYVVSMAAAAIATIAATWPLLLIVAAVGLVVAAILWLVANWSTVVKFLQDTWNNVASFFASIGDGIASWWNGFWGGIFGFVKKAWDTYVGIITSQFTALWNGLVSIGDGISSWWNGLWGGLVGFVQTVWRGAANGIIGFFNGVIDLVDGLIAGLNTVLAGIKTISGGAINLTIGKIPHLPSFDVGGTIPGAPGAPIPILAHGGEEMASNAMLAGQKPLPPRIMAAADKQRGGSGGNTVNVYAQTNASPKQIASAASWELRRMG